MDDHCWDSIYYPIIPTEAVANSTEGFISGLFVIPKRWGGGYRPIVILKSLNKFVRTEHFRMEGINSLQDLIRREDFLVKIDLKDAYLTIPIREEDKIFFRICLGGGRIVSVSVPCVWSLPFPLVIY